MTRTARYDGHADWYDDNRRPFAAEHAAAIAALLGPGTGRCLDLGCGTALYAAAVAATGRTVVGVDRSADQLRVAAARTGRLVQADAAGLPFRDGSFRTVTALWISTDVDDMGAVLGEAVRVLEPGGTLLYYGVHPCFNGPHTEPGPAGTVIVHREYAEAGWHFDVPWWGRNIRRRFGMRHVPLAELLNAFLDAGLVIARVAEPARDPLPVNLAILATRP